MAVLVPVPVDLDKALEVILEDLVQVCGPRVSGPVTTLARFRHDAGLPPEGVLQADSMPTGEEWFFQGINSHRMIEKSSHLFIETGDIFRHFPPSV